MTPESGLDIAGPTAESYRTLYPPPGTIISRPWRTGFSRYIFSGAASPTFPMAKFCISNRDCWDWVSSQRSKSALSDEPSGQIGWPLWAEKRMAWKSAGSRPKRRFSDHHRQLLGLTTRRILRPRTALHIGAAQLHRQARPCAAVRIALLRAHCSPTLVAPPDVSGVAGRRTTLWTGVPCTHKEQLGLPGQSELSCMTGSSPSLSSSLKSSHQTTLQTDAFWTWVALYAPKYYIQSPGRPSIASWQSISWKPNPPRDHYVLYIYVLFI